MNKSSRPRQSRRPGCRQCFYGMALAFLLFAGLVLAGFWLLRSYGG